LLEERVTDEPVTDAMEQAGDDDGKSGHKRTCHKIGEALRARALEER